MGWAHPCRRRPPSPGVRGRDLAQWKATTQVRGRGAVWFQHWTCNLDHPIQRSREMETNTACWGNDWHNEESRQVQERTPEVHCEIKLKKPSIVIRDCVSLRVQRVWQHRSSLSSRPRLGLLITWVLHLGLSGCEWGDDLFLRITWFHIHAFQKSWISHRQ